MSLIPIQINQSIIRIIRIIIRSNQINYHNSDWERERSWFISFDWLIWWNCNNYESTWLIDWLMMTSLSLSISICHREWVTCCFDCFVLTLSHHQSVISFKFSNSIHQPQTTTKKKKYFPFLSFLSCDFVFYPSSPIEF